MRGLRRNHQAEDREGHVGLSAAGAVKSGGRGLKRSARSNDREGFLSGSLLTPAASLSLRAIKRNVSRMDSVRIYRIERRSRTTSSAPVMSILNLEEDA